MVAQMILYSAFWESIGPRLIVLVVLAFFAILFLQSGIDKVTDRKGNLDWLGPHFSKSPFRNSVPVLLTILTFLELLSGIAAAITAFLTLFIDLHGFWLPFAIATLCAITLLVLFMGQRLAKDYAGAAGIVPYFIVAVGSMIFFMLL
jgi:putative oxidoreductase